jgi:hypothetical protein
LDQTLVTFLSCEVWCLLGALFLLIGYRILTGKIKLNGLLSAKHRDGGLSPARIQLLVLTLTGAFYYVMKVIDNPTELPAVPQSLLLALGGSNLFYAGSKAYHQLPWLRNRSNDTGTQKGGT